MVFLKRFFVDTEEPKFCAECIFSLKTERDIYDLFCTNIKVDLVA